MRLYVFGNGNLSFTDFLTLYHEPLTRLPLAGDGAAQVLVADFRGVDTLAMECLKCLTPNVRVYHVGARPRYLPDKFRTKVGQWQLVGGFADDAARDAAAIEACTHFLAHDFNSDANRTSGTRRNIERCLELGKTRLEGGT
ncbi:MAG TPA: hypothetical protein VFS43_39520 [Polyangiaceae bacterium]|nr:hypothetical protein [Polyangiaceae bacterium]